MTPRCWPSRSSIAASIPVTTWIVVRRSNVCRPRPPASRSAKVVRTLVSTFLYSPSVLPTTSGMASSSVLRIFSPPGISPTPVCPELSLITTILRVKNGAWAPLRFISMLSCPATGMICMEVTTGVENVLIVRSFFSDVQIQGAYGQMSSRG